MIAQKFHSTKAQTSSTNVAQKAMVVVGEELLSKI
jgi:hypothetical protein